MRTALSILFVFCVLLIFSALVQPIPQPFRSIVMVIASGVFGWFAPEMVEWRDRRWPKKPPKKGGPRLL